MILTGCDRLLQGAEALGGRRFAILAASASLSRDLEPLHLALIERGHRPELLLAPEHGYHSVEQDMVASGHAADPWSGIPIHSLYRDSEASLRPEPGVLAGLDLLIIDLQDVGARYYTYAATAVWAARAAVEEGCEVWVLDRPNPLGGEVLEGNLRRTGFESFVGAFELPVRHGLTLGELVRLEAVPQGWLAPVRVWEMEGWQRSMTWEDLGRPWIAPSPNLPSLETAWTYPGSCLLEATSLSEGRGTTRPFLLAGAPGVDGLRLARELASRGLAGVRFVPTLFRPQHQKHAGSLCGGVQVVVEDRRAFSPLRCGVEILAAARRVAPEAFAWRREAYEFVTDRPAIDLLAGDDALRRILDAGGDAGDWIAGWRADERAFRESRRPALLYPEAER